MQGTANQPDGDRQPPASSPIVSVHLLSTGEGELHEEHRSGSRMPRLWWVLTSKSWVRVPINAFLINHRDGLVLFDTGLDPAIKTEANYISSAIGRFLLHKIFRLHVRPGDRLGLKLDELGFAASDVCKAVISHLHFDHVGGIADIPQADLLVSKDEWAQLSSPHPEREWILREHIEIPDAKWVPINFSPPDEPLLEPFGGTYDVMGDGSLILLPTPGHTPGSMSMLVRSVGMAPLLLIGDLTYQTEYLMNDQVPGTGDREALLTSFKRVRALKRSLTELVILASHDLATAQALNEARGVRGGQPH